MKRANITTLILLVYLIVMSILYWPGSARSDLDYTEFFCVIGITLVVIFILRFVQVKRARMRDEWKKNNPNP